MQNEHCPDCAAEGAPWNRREFLRTTAAGAGLLLPGSVRAALETERKPESLVKTLYDSLTEAQKKEVCFDWDHKTDRGLLRTHVSNNWQITNRHIDSDFFTADQKELCKEIYKGIFNPDWHERLFKQLKDDTGGRPWGAEQSIAIFGTPGTDKFEFVMTGRHLTTRCDGNTQPHVAFGGPIFHGHAASDFNERVGHPGNVFWPQAQKANKVYQILDGKQQEQALVKRRPAESAVAFRGNDGPFPGLPLSEATKDQRQAVADVLTALLEPYRKEDQEEVRQCLMAAGGLEKCAIAFYAEGDLGDDGEWDNWRIEGPSFVWYFRGTPHVHIWINVADNPSVELNARG
jgi:hypothetical protein